MKNDTMQGRSVSAKKQLSSLYSSMCKRIGKVLSQLVATSNPVLSAQITQTFNGMSDTVVDLHSGSNNRLSETAVKISKSGERTNATDGKRVAAVVSFHRNLLTNEKSDEFVARIGATIRSHYQWEIGATKKDVTKVIGDTVAGNFPRSGSALNAVTIPIGIAVTSAETRGALRCSLLDDSVWTTEIEQAVKIAATERGFAGIDKTTGEELTQEQARADQDEADNEAVDTAALNKAEKDEMIAAKLMLVPGAYLPEAYAKVIVADQKAAREAYKAEHGEAPTKEQGRRLDGERLMAWVETFASNAVKLATAPAKTKRSKKVA